MALVPAHGRRPTSFSTTPSHVMRAATSRPASPIAAARGRFWASWLIAAPSASGVGSQMQPFDAVDDELGRTARVRAGDHRLAGEERLERHVAEVFVEGRIEHCQRAGVEIDAAVSSSAAPRKVTRSATPPVSARAARRWPAASRRRPRSAGSAGRRGPSRAPADRPASPIRCGRPTARSRRTARTSAAARAAADGRAPRPTGR